jgi:L-ascorbate metabolism protein UlaG (beta-lactamase superfamily)
VLSNRRRFLKYALSGMAVAAGAGTYWAATSKRRTARWLRTMIQDSRRAVLSAQAKPTPGLWSDNAISIAWIGHATVLINFYGVHILTDPSFASRVGINIGLGTLGPKRFIAPALTLRELPRIDLILLSHAHMDHIDLWSLERLGLTTPVVTASQTGDVVTTAGLRDITELGWNERTTVRSANGELEIEAVEVKHWGVRWPSGLERGYNGYILRREGKSLLIAGDTAQTELFSQIRAKGPFEVAVMPIGAYDPWIRNHCTPEQAVEMANAAGARYVAPVHHQTFRLSREPMSEPIERFQAALVGEPERIAFKNVGETFFCGR